MIRLLTRDDHRVILINENCFSRIAYDKVKLKVCLYRVNNVLEDEVGVYTNIAEVDYITTNSFYRDAYNVFSFHDSEIGAKV